MKMSAARIRSMFRRHDSVQEHVFRFTRNVQPVTRFIAAPAPATTSQPSTRLAALSEHYRAAMQRELAKLGL
jgi:DNA-binding transcriptional LysR family regulator